MRFLLLFIALLLILPAAAQAGEVVQCGIPKDIDVETMPKADYCDIYTRQIAYREKDDAYREKLEERRRNFAGPRSQALQSYDEKLIAHHAAIENKTQTASSTPQDEADQDMAQDQSAKDQTSKDPKAPINLLDGVQ